MNEFILTKKHKEIQHLLYRFRFLSRIHIQELLGHHEPSRINRWLAELRKNNYIGRDYNEKAGENRNPGIYYLEKKGLEFIIKTHKINNNYIQKLRNEEKISLSTKEHSLKATDFYLLLAAYAKHMQHILRYYAKADLANLPLYQYVKPDGYFTYETSLGKRNCFIEIDLETESKITIRKKMKKYIDLYYTNKWETSYSKTFPIIGIICLTDKRQNLLLRVLQELLTEMNISLSFKLTTFNQLNNYGISAKIWKSIRTGNLCKII